MFKYPHPWHRTTHKQNKHLVQILLEENIGVVWYTNIGFCFACNIRPLQSPLMVLQSVLSATVLLDLLKDHQSIEVGLYSYEMKNLIILLTQMSSQSPTHFTSYSCLQSTTPMLNHYKTQLSIQPQITSSFQLLYVLSNNRP